MSDLVIFEDENLKLEVKLDEKNDTVWLSQKQISKLFDKDRKTITRHIQNIFFDDELCEKTVCSFFEHTAEDDKKYSTKHYNLDMIISIGYRVNSKRGIAFRRWATSVLKDYMIKGYAKNQDRLVRLEKTLKLIDIASNIDQNLSDDESKAIFKVISTYGQALKLLDDYDHKCIYKPEGITEEKQLTYEEIKILINEMKNQFDSTLFGRERDNGFASCIATIYQTYDGVELYKSIQEKASNLLYLIVKNHTFIDGNKRIAAVVFLYYLYKNDLLYRDDNKIISEHTLVALTLLIAQSNPREKEIIIDLAMNFLV